MDNDWPKTIVTQGSGHTRQWLGDVTPTKQALTKHIHTLVPQCNCNYLFTLQSYAPNYILLTVNNLMTAYLCSIFF
jgi:hypothetical protein